MNGGDYGALMRAVLPELALVLTALAVLIWDQFLGRQVARDLRTRVGIVLFGIGSLVTMRLLMGLDFPVDYLAGLWRIDPIIILLKLVIVVLAVFTACLSLESRFTEHPGEFLLLLILATLGLMFLISSEHLLMLFVALELTSLTLYVLTAMNSRQRESAEAGLKYFLFGGVSAAFLLFGLSLIYGLTGELRLSAIAKALWDKPLDPLLLLAMVMILIGFGFKVATAPFHMWAPDVYEGAPVPCAAFIASASKIGGFFVLALVLVVGLAGAGGDSAWHRWRPGWTPLVAVLAVLSMVLGNLAAIAQSRVRRLLAYSAIAHAGYVLVGLLAANPQGISALVYYIITYALTTLGAFGVVAVVLEKTGSDALGNFAGLSRRAPLLSLCMLVFMLSLAGIPPLAGFFGKVYLFLAALNVDSESMGLLWLVIVALSMSVVSLYYYLMVLKQIYVAAPAEEMPAIRPLPSTQVVIGLLALLVLGLGICPELIIGHMERLLTLGGR
jgi:NADH-quinone oxidoreductase subunit N